MIVCTFWESQKKIVIMTDQEQNIHCKYYKNNGTLCGKSIYCKYLINLCKIYNNHLNIKHDKSAIKLVRKKILKLSANVFEPPESYAMFIESMTFLSE